MGAKVTTKSGLRIACEKAAKLICIDSPPSVVPAQALADLLKAAESILEAHERALGITK